MITIRNNKYERFSLANGLKLPINEVSISNTEGFIFKSFDH